MPNDNAGGWPDPTREMLNGDPLFDAIYRCIKYWDVWVPDKYSGYCGATGNHARAIYDAIAAEVTAREEAAAVAMREKCLSWDAILPSNASQAEIELVRRYVALVGTQVPLPTAALDALLAQAREEGAKAEREACLHIVDSTATTDGRASQQIMKRIRARGDA